MLASMVLLLPTLFYLSRQQQPYNVAKDFALMQTQKSQGDGAPPALEPQMAQSWKWSKPLAGWGPGAGTFIEKSKAVLGGGDGKGGGDQTAEAPAGAVMPKMENVTAK